MTLVPRDATKGWWFATNAAECTSLLGGTGISNPQHLWPMQEADVPFADGIGSIPLNVAGSRYDPNLTVAGFSRKGQRSRADEFESSNTKLVDPSTTSSMLMTVMICESAVSPADSQNIYIGLAGTYARWFQTTARHSRLQATTTVDGTAALGTRPHVLALQSNFAASKVRMVTDQEVLELAIGAPGSTKYIALNGNTVAVGACVYLWAAEWDGAASEMTAAQVQTVIDRIMNGPGVTSIAVTPTSYSIAPLATQQMTATATRADGSTYDCTATATWLSSDPTKATVSATGLVTGVAAGTTNITASFTSLNAATATSPGQTVTVSGGGVTLTSISISSSSTPVAGGSVQFTAIGNYSDGSHLDLTTLVTWASSNPAVARIASTGIADFMFAAGTTTITATL